MAIDWTKLTPEQIEALSQAGSADPTPQRGTYTDPNTGAMWAWQIVDGKVQQQEIRPGTMGPPYTPKLDTINTPQGVKVVDLNAVSPGSVIPGTAPAPTRPPEPTVNTSAKEIPEWDGSNWIWKPNPNYVAPSQPQGPAFSGTQAGMDYASGLNMAEQENASKLRRQEIIDKFEADKKYAAWEVEQGLKTTVQASAELKAKSDTYAAELGSYYRQLETANKYNAELPMAKWQQEQQRRQMELQGQTQALSGYKAMADQGQGFVDKLTAGGVAPSEGSMNLAWAPMQQMWGIIQKLQQQGIVTPDMIPQPMAAPQAPVAPTFGQAQQAPVAPVPQAPIAPLPVQ
jgi:hypothetical protein